MNNFKFLALCALIYFGVSGELPTPTEAGEALRTFWESTVAFFGPKQLEVGAKVLAFFGAFAGLSYLAGRLEARDRLRRGK